ncbi:unnamed protein product [Discosporangium mesarthrocarpum]
MVRVLSVCPETHLLLPRGALVVNSYPLLDLFLQVVPLVVAILLAGMTGAAPVLLTDSCGDAVPEKLQQEALNEVQRTMRKKRRPKELLVLTEGNLYKVPEGVDMVTPPDAGKWNMPLWVEDIRFSMCQSLTGQADKRKERELRANEDERSEKACSVHSAGEHSCKICYDALYDTVVLSCGHGGMCWECALNICVLTNECPMCRLKIKQLVQISPSTTRTEGYDTYVPVVGPVSEVKEV